MEVDVRLGRGHWICSGGEYRRCRWHRRAATTAKPYGLDPRHYLGCLIPRFKNANRHYLLGLATFLSFNTSNAAVNTKRIQLIASINSRAAVFVFSTASFVINKRIKPIGNVR